MSDAVQPHEIIIRPDQGLGFPSIQELRPYRDLIKMMAKRDLAVRYRQTAIGILWAVLQPALLAVVFSVFLGLLAKVPSDSGIPYPLYAFSGMVIWLCFVNALTNAAESTVAAGDLISKVYFPRIIIPMVALVVPVVDFAIAFVVLLVAMVAYGYIPGPEILLTPVALALAVATAFGSGLWFSALNVRYRDFRFLVPFLTLAGMFVTPVIYPFGLVPDALQPLYALNPMVGVLELYRWMLFGHTSADWWLILIPVASSVVLIVTGALYFRHAERSFADLI
jgi:lipopolysaccharide transport system permease protein